MRFLHHTLIVFAMTIGTYGFSQSQPPGGSNGPEGEYELGHVKQRSEAAHKREDKINKHNNKALDKSNKAAEKDRKDKLSKQKKKNDEHQFKF